MKIRWYLGIFFFTVVSQASEQSFPTKASTLSNTPQKEYISPQEYYKKTGDNKYILYPYLHPFARFMKQK